MKTRNTRLLTLASVLAALTTVATLIQIPRPHGYINLGDTIVNCAGWILGPAYGAAAAGIGSALADIVSGYAIYAPATLLIKGAMAAASWALYSGLSRRFPSLPARVCAAAVAEVIMAAGYSLYEVAIYRSISIAVLSVPGNLIQGIIGAAVSVVIYEAVIKRLPKFGA